MVHPTGPRPPPGSSRVVRLPQLVRQHADRSAFAELKAAGEGDAAFLDAKLVTARFFAERIVPDAGALRRKIEGGAESLMALPPEMFRAA